MPEHEGRDYNYTHFRTGHVIAEAARTWKLQGIRPGQPAPDFQLDDADGGTWRLSEHRGRPVLLHFGSYS